MRRGTTDGSSPASTVTPATAGASPEPDAVWRSVRKGLKVETWPERERTLWQRSKTRRGLFDREAILHGLKPPTVRGLEQTAGRFLAYTEWRGLLPREGSVCSVLTPELIDAYAAFMREGLRAGSIHEELRRLRTALGILLPGSDLSWMNSLPARPTRTEVLSSRKPIVRPDAARVLGVAYRVFDAIGKDDPNIVSCLAARDCLSVAFCVLFDLRLKNLTEIRFGEHLRCTGGRWQLAFLENVKNDVPLVFHVPTELAKRIEIYRGAFRAALLGKRHDPGNLWLGRTGRPIREAAVATGIERFGQTHLGRDLNSHVFRHCFASTTVARNPADADLAAAALGHRSQQMVLGTYTASTTDELSKIWLRKLAGVRKGRYS